MIRQQVFKLQSSDYWLWVVDNACTVPKSLYVMTTSRQSLWVLDTPAVLSWNESSIVKTFTADQRSNFRRSQRSIDVWRGRPSRCVGGVARSCRCCVIAFPLDVVLCDLSQRQPCAHVFAVAFHQRQLVYIRDLRCVWLDGAPRELCFDYRCCGEVVWRE